ncbi:MAG: peptidylprolyl isomerase [Clostridia bacterium]|nr:peptidylprolyl isomerase [Clostridia bacterium]
MKRIGIALFLAVAMLLGFAGCGNSSAQGLDDVVYVEIDMVGGGYMKLELYTKIAPITVENFVNLCNEHFYDGLIFHRVISGLIIQGGDPLGTGYGGSKQMIKGEFRANGVENNLSHTRGVISMARQSGNMDSASSQFFILVGNYPSWDGNYAAFGKVVEGFETLDAIASVPTDANDRPLNEQRIKTIRVITREEMQTPGPAETVAESEGTES